MPSGLPALLNKGGTVCEQCDKVKTELLTWVEDAREFIKGMITSKCPDIEALMKLPLEELPLKINDFEDGTPERLIIKRRLEGKDPLEEDLGTIVQVLWDVDFDYEDYKNMGHNDGIIVLLSKILTMMGDEESAKRAYEVIYSD